MNVAPAVEPRELWRSKKHPTGTFTHLSPPPEWQGTFLVLKVDKSGAGLFGSEVNKYFCVDIISEQGTILSRFWRQEEFFAHFEFVGSVKDNQ